MIQRRYASYVFIVRFSVVFDNDDDYDYDDVGITAEGVVVVAVVITEMNTPFQKGIRGEKLIRMRARSGSKKFHSKHNGA